MKIAHVQSLFSPEHGGPTHSLRNYCLGAVERGHDVYLYVLEGHTGASPAVRLNRPIKQTVCKVVWPRKLGRSPELKEKLRKADKPDIYHLHGAWHRSIWYAYKEAKRRGVPIVLELMGSFSEYELGRKTWRKRVARAWFQNEIIDGVSCLHTNSEKEALQLRRLGFDQPIAVIPVGVRLERPESFASETTAVPREWNGSPWVLFLGRLHPTKGIEPLLQAWQKIGQKYEKWKLLICGTGDPAYTQKLREMVGQLGIGNRCHFSGLVSETEKRALYVAARYFILPSFQENFGNTVAEALSFGTPAITTKATPWTELESLECGWTCNPNEDDLVAALSTAIEAPPDFYAKMRRNATALAATRYSLEITNDGIERVYKWLRGGEKPSDLMFDDIPKDGKAK